MPFEAGAELASAAQQQRMLEASRAARVALAMAWWPAFQSLAGAVDNGACAIEAAPPAAAPLMALPEQQQDGQSLAHDEGAVRDAKAAQLALHVGCNDPALHDAFVALPLPLREAVQGSLERGLMARLTITVAAGRAALVLR